MTDWKVVRGTQETEPLEVDTSLSTDTVYLRKNIEQIEVKDVVTEDTVQMWQYEEKEMTVAEYTQYLMIRESTKTITSFQAQNAIDEYTMQLMEEGVL